ncbi:hypothetical protein GQ54DRAFT_296152, partial [Martensiomyces pterosporus]
PLLPPNLSLPLRLTTSADGTTATSAAKSITLGTGMMAISAVRLTMLAGGTTATSAARLKMRHSSNPDALW